MKRILAMGICVVAAFLIMAASVPCKAADQSRGRIYDVRSYGAQGDDRTIDTAAIQSAIDSCAQGGGTVILQRGVFLSGTIELRNDVRVEIAPTATLRGVTETLYDKENGQYYPYLSPPTSNSQLLNCRRALIYGVGLKNVTIGGGGVINGGGTFPSWNGKGMKEAVRPMAIFLVQSQNVVLENLKIEHAAMWSIVNMENDGVTIHDITVNSPDGPNRDGIDVVDSHHVLIENDDVNSQDDSVCLKSGSDMGVADVVVRNVHIRKSSVANGLKLGTASKGSFERILFENVEIENVKQGALAVESVDGAAIRDLTFRNITLRDVGTAFYVVLGRRGNTPKTGSIDGVRFENISGDTIEPWGSAVSGDRRDGVTDYVRNLNFSHVHLEADGHLDESGKNSVPEYTGEYPDPRLWGDLPAFGLFFRHIDGLKLFDIKIESRASEHREAIVTEDVLSDADLNTEGN
jgi:polygalacturonase